jgi:hypothetical protein
MKLKFKMLLSVALFSLIVVSFYACNQINRDTSNENLATSKIGTESNVVAKIQNEEIKLEISTKDINSFCEKYVSKQIKNFKVEKSSIKKGSNGIYFIEAVSKTETGFITVGIPLENDGKQNLKYEGGGGSGGNMSCVHTCTSSNCACSISNIDQCRGHKCECSGGCSANVIIQ